jgi:LPXTG-site transpeptidase (sortase) family protein
MLLKRTPWLVLIAGIVLASVLYYHLSNKPVAASIPLAVSVPQVLTSVSIGLPLRLRIPTINVDAAVQAVGLASDGAMETPKSLHDVGWYRTGQRPGEVGSAVIDGHFGSDIEAVFNKLGQLRQGDRLSVEDDAGVVTPFIVREIRNYDPSANAVEVFNSNDARAHLNLITCEGVWNAATDSYSKRLVVFTDKQ